MVHQMHFRKGSLGVTLIELIVAMGILTILVSGILPLSYMTYKRSKEIELRQNLRVIRNAIDDYKKMVDDGRIAMELDGTGYPATLEILVEGVDSNDPDPIKYKFLRRIPKDPMTEDGEWGCDPMPIHRTVICGADRTSMMSTQQAKSRPWMKPTTGTGKK